MSTQECLDAYEIVQGLVTHPGLKPHQRRQAEALLKDIKANLENSDDEGETSRPDDQQMGPAQTPPRPTPAISAAPRQTQAAAIRTKAHQFPPRESAHSEKPGAQRDLGALASKPQSTGISGDMERALNSRGLRTFLSAEGDQFLASITASQNTHMSPPTAPALDTRPPQAPRPEPNSRPAQAPHTNLGPSLSPRPRQPDVHEPTKRPTKYRFDNVRLEGMENDVAAKKARVGSPGSDDDADGSTDDGDNSDQPPAQPPVPVVLDHGLGHTRPFQCGPRQPPAHRLPGTEFMTQDMFRNYTIPRDRTQGPSANAQQERPKDRSGALLLIPQLQGVQDHHQWSFCVWPTPANARGHLHQLCVSENILKVAGSLSLITPDMVDMGKITTKAPGKDGHILAPNLANFFAPPKVAYTRLKSTLEQSWSTLHFSDVKNQWFSKHLTTRMVSTRHMRTSANHTKTSEQLLVPPTPTMSPDQPWTWFKHSAMLANLLIFGPTAAFTSLRKSQFVSLANANAMLELGSSVLKQKLALGISAPMPHSTFDNLRLHFLNFLVRMGFTQLDKDGVPNVDWKQVHKAFYNDFSPLVVSQLVSQDVEIALEHRLG
ncbi:hypothetical protein PSTT_17132 [Puccinia striiformis]|uniref:Uncharacterized protein n=1 Tax=Puccinia striiformis TaxID=27350 RepID=A0A2S4U9J7_9BASI|nr:hypothetical protein PSTT_17132 [Puccinia striiformis]